MKTLYLLRHAKSSWKKEELSDRDRPLKKKGRWQADAMSDHLSSLLPPPARVLCSPAVRTRETLEYFLEVWPLAEPNVSFPEALYLAEVEALREEVGRLPDQADIAMVVAHNPGLTDLVHYWNQAKGAYMKSIRTCGFVQMDFEVESWADVASSEGTMEGTIKLDLRPKDLPS